MKMMKSFTVWGAALGFVVTAFAQTSSNFVEGEILVKFKPGTEASTLNKLGGRVLSRNDTLGFVRVQVPIFNSMTDNLNRYRNEASVVVAEPNYIYTKAFTPNDPLFGQQYAHKRIKSELAWNKQRGNPNVVIAIIDTGVDIQHPDLAAKLTSGYDFVDNDNDPDDADGHGTHCAGIAAGIGNNGIGIAGLALNCRIMPVRVLGSFGGTAEWVANGITYAANNGAKVLSLSLGSPGASTMIHDAIKGAVSRGAVVVAAAGNNGVTDKFYPAGFPETIAVASTDQNDARSGFSNYGKDWVDVAAPGSGILSTLPGGYGNASGTSMACPYVAGLAGLVFSSYPGASNTTIRNRIESTCDNVGDFVAFGRINADRAIPASGGSGALTWTPVAMSIFEGASMTGTTTNVRASDNSYAFVNSALVQRLGHVSSTRLTFTSPLTAANLIEPKIRIEAAGLAGTSSSVFLWNYTTNNYDFVGSMPMTTTDSTRELNLPRDMTRYMNADRSVVMLVRAINPAGMGRAVTPFQLRLDLTQMSGFRRSN
jgi:thermitase